MVTSDHATKAEGDERAAAPGTSTTQEGSGTSSRGLGGLQRTAGKCAVSMLVQRLAVQRQPPGTALPDGAGLASSVGQAVAGAVTQQVPTQDPAAAGSGPGTARP